MKYFGLFKDFPNKNIVIKGNVEAELLGCGDYSITVKFPNQKTDCRSAVAIAVVDNSNKYLWYEDCKITTDEFTLDLKSFDFLKIETSIEKFKIYLVFKNENNVILSRLYSKKVKKNYSKTKNRKLLYYDKIGEKERYSVKYDHYKTYVLIANITVNGFFGLMVFRKDRLLSYRIENYITDFEIKKDCFSLELKLAKYENAEISLKMRSYFRDEKYYMVYFDLKEDSIREFQDYYIYKCTVNRNMVQNCCGETLKLMSCYTIDNQNYYVNFSIKSQKAVKRYTEKCLYDFSADYTKPTDLLSRIVDDGRLEFYTVIPVNYREKTDYKSLDEYIYSLDRLPMRAINGIFTFYKENIFAINIKMDTSPLDNIKFFVFQPGSTERVILSCSFHGDGGYIVDLSNMKKTMLNDISPKDYNLCVSFEYRGKYYSAKLRCFEKGTAYVGENDYRDFVPDFKREAVWFTGENGIIVSALPTYNYGGYIQIKTGERAVLSKNYVSVPYVKHSLNGDILKITVDITDTDYDFKGFTLSFRYKKPDDKQEYYIEGKTFEKSGRTYFNGQFNLSEYKLKRIIWDIYAVFNVEDKQYFASIAATDKQVCDSFHNKKIILFGNEYKIKNGKSTDVFFSYFTEKNTLAFIVREKGKMDSRFFKFKEFSALFLSRLFQNKLKKKRIILTYEKNCKCAQDNGYVFFRRCMDKQADKSLNANIYYVIDKKSPDYSKVKKYKKNLINFLSLKHMVYILASALIVSSESTKHLYGWRPNSSPVARKIKDKKYVFLQHGVLALKRVDSVFGYGKSSQVDMFITSSKTEQKIVTENFHYPLEKVCVTGLARWDDLVDKSQNTREILLMPTFRIWLDEATDEDFVSSDYYKGYMELLKSERLDKILEENDLKLNFYMHPRFSSYVKSFNIYNSRIRIIPYGEEPVNELMMRCKLLITDYSSVCWDVFYMGKPVLFYQFDYDMYNKVHGSYIDMKNNLFGDRSEDLHQLFDDLENCINNNFALTENQRKKRDYSFGYIDKQNCSRIIRVIKNMEW